MFCFDFDKMMQALGVLIRQPGTDQDNYYKLLKLLYLAEKRSLQEKARPITGDLLVAMQHGPALSATCSLLRGEDDRPGWRAHFIPSGKYTIRMVAEPGDDLLSDYEIGILKAVAQEHASRNWREMHRFCHALEEQRKNDPGSSSKGIPLEDILPDARKREQAREAAAVHVAFRFAFGK